MRERKGRKIVLAILFLLIAGGVLTHIRISGVDAKSQLANEVYSARELIAEIRSGEADGSWSDSAVETFAAVVEAAAEVQSDLNATDEQAEEALQELKEARKALKAAEGTTEAVVETEPEPGSDGMEAETAGETALTEEETEKKQSGKTTGKAQKSTGSEEKNTVAGGVQADAGAGKAETLDNGDKATVPDMSTDSGSISGGVSYDTGGGTKKSQKETEKKKIKADGELDLTGKGSGTTSETEKKQETEKKPEQSESTPATEPPKKETEAPKKTCTITIRCETILRNMRDLREGLAGYVPSNGVILKKTTVELYDGETVFEVLKRVTRMAGLKLEFRNDSVHGAGYIVGINHLDEFDCGSGSGWMYTVNGWFPNYGCSKYVLQDKDVIQWIYTCDLGRDIGGNFWE